MSALTECPYFAAKGMHLYVGYRVAATGQTGECCHGCGADADLPRRGPNRPEWSLEEDDGSNV